MQIKLKQRGFLGYKKTSNSVAIDDLIVKEDLISPENEKVMVYFKGQDSSGILEFSKDEIEALNSSLKSGIGLVKKSKKLVGKK